MAIDLTKLRSAFSGDQSKKVSVNKSWLKEVYELLLERRALMDEVRELRRYKRDTEHMTRGFDRMDRAFGRMDDNFDRMDENFDSVFGSKGSTPRSGFKGFKDFFKR